LISTTITAVVTTTDALGLQTTQTHPSRYSHHSDPYRSRWRNEDDLWCYRRRDRCSVAMTDSGEQPHNNNINDNNNNDDDDVPGNSGDGAAESLSLSSCPFSKNFPRYRIDLTTSGRKKNRNNNQKEDGIWSLLPSVELPSLELPSPPWKEAMQKDQLEKVARKMRGKGDRNGNGDVEVVVKPGIDGVAAFAGLWEESARLMGMIEGPTPPSQDSSSVVVLGLPETSGAVVRNFCEIVEWMATTTAAGDGVGGEDYESEESIGASNGWILEARILEDESLDVPAVRLERKALAGPTPPASSEDGRNNSESIRHNGAAAPVVNERTRLWVKRVLVELGICPFTKSDRMSGQGLVDLGVPVGSIAYHASFQRHPIGLFADTWRAIDEMIRAGPEGRKGVSSILLAAPEFDDDFDLWAGPVFAMLEAGVVAAGAESRVGVVCFHPRYATPDGKSWPGFGHMHSVPRLEKWYREETTLSGGAECPLTTEEIAAGGAWQRRTPHATINVLRADQLEAAESRRVSGKMYAENIDKLVGADGIGNEKLALDLRCERERGSYEP